jgi:hypothetical protein
VLVQYNGSGRLALADGTNAPCEFVAGHLADGLVLLACDFAPPYIFPFPAAPTSFTGTLHGGQPLGADALTEVTYLADPPTGRAFMAREIVVGLEDAGAAQARFALTNFRFLVLPLRLSQPGGEVIEVVIVPRQDYGKTDRVLGAVGGITVTCDAVIRTAARVDRAPARRVMDDLCYVLSVARGTKVQWVAESLATDDGAVVQTSLCNRVTKPVTRLPTIDPRAGARDETRRFIETAFPRYVALRDSHRLALGTIDTYLDARAEGDYLEVRGAKIGVALEALKDVFLRQRSFPVSEFILAQEDFARLRVPIREALRRVLAEHDVAAAQRGQIYRHIAALNRTAFSEILRGILQEFGLAIDNQDVRLLIASRNKLVHTGRFYADAAGAAERQELPPLPSVRDEFFFLLSFLDRCFLRLLGYDGPWIDWRQPGNPAWRPTVTSPN